MRNNPVYIISVVLSFMCLYTEGQSCKIGDLITNKNDNTRGIVFWVNPERSGGWMVALEDLKASKWGDIYNFPKDLPLYALTDTAGYENTKRVREFYAGKDYAVHKVDIDNGWYLPAAGQLFQLYTRQFLINPLLESLGGQKLTGNYWSSTFVKRSRVWGCYFNPATFCGTFPCESENKVRAIRSFSMSSIVHDTTWTYRWNTGATEAFIDVSPVKTTTYTVKATSREGCGMAASRQIFVAADREVNIRDTIRRGEVYAKNGFHETEAGVYKHTIRGENGCEVEVTLTLIVLEPLAPTVWNERICRGQVYSKHNFMEYEEGTYTQHWNAVDGRDSAVVLNLSVLPTFRDTIRAKICEGEVYEEQGFSSSEAGFHELSLTTVNGCDSVSVLHLSVLPDYLFETEATICKGTAYDFRGRLLAESGVYFDSLKTLGGCDSVYRLALTVNPALKDTLEAAVCEGKTYTENGFSVSDAGFHNRFLKTSLGCDSIVTLKLDVLPNYRFDSDAEICNGETYDFRGRLLTESGVYFDSLKTLAGCDSVYRLVLAVHPVYRDTIRAKVCEGEMYEDNGFRENTAGFYTNSYETVSGCDSSVILDLQVEPLFAGNLRILPENCERHEYRFVVDPLPPVSSECQWQFGDGADSREVEPLHSYADTGQYSVIFIVKSVEGCVRQLVSSHTVPYFPKEVRIYSDRIKIEDTNPEVHLWTDAFPGLIYRWDMDDGHILDGAEIRHLYEVEETREYEVQLEVIDDGICRAEQMIRISASKTVIVPNTFSPNQDGVNDRFMEGFRVEIIDRNGVRIYRGDSGWDGTRNGKAVPEDTYFYVVYIPSDEGERKVTGYLTLVR